MAMTKPRTLWRVIAVAGCLHVQSFLPQSNHAFVSKRTRTRFQSPALPSASMASFESTVPRIQDNHLQQLKEQGYVVIPNFLSQDLQADLRKDVSNLRSSGRFKIAKIGQDSTNTLNQEIRVAETCFLGPSKLQDVPCEARSHLYNVLDQVRNDLDQPLDPNLTELLYAYYPKGGFYRRHRDAIPGSASVLRSISLLLYLNKDWTEKDGGQLLLHRDSGGDFLPDGEEANFVEVEPQGGTLVLFESSKIPHEVLDTKAERLAVVGWYNRPLSVSDMNELGGGGAMQPLLLAVAGALVTVGVIMAMQ